MLYIISFIFFLIYTIAIFFIQDFYILGIIVMVNIILMVILRENIKKAFFAICKLIPFIIFTSCINTIASGITWGIIIGVRLIIVCNITYIFFIRITPSKLQYIIETLLKPLNIINIDSKEIGIIVCIGITFMPILKREIEEIKYTLNAKGFKLNFRNIIRKPNYILVPLIVSIIKKVGEIEDSLISKGYACAMGACAMGTEKIAQK